MYPLDIDYDGWMIIRALEFAGVQQYEPGVVLLLLNFVVQYKRALIVLLNAVSSLSGSSKDAVTDKDAILAMHIVTTTQFPEQSSFDVLAQWAHEQNTHPLPRMLRSSNLKLPPDDECVTQPNYDVVKMRIQSARGIAET